MYGSGGDFGSYHHLAGSSSSSAAAGNPTIGYPLLHQHHHHHQQELHHTMMIPIPPPPPPPPFIGGSDGDDEFLRRDERFPYWSDQETRDLIEIRADVERSFPAAKRARNLWDMVSQRMRDKGYWRSADQCKWKWKYLVSKYKEQEASDADTVAPFFNEMHAAFASRTHRHQQSQVEAETGVTNGRKRLNDASESQSNEELTEEQEDDEGIVSRKGKAGRGKRQMMRKNDEDEPGTNANKKGSTHNVLQEIMRKFLQQQRVIDMEWRASMDRHAEERERIEQEWQQKMERLERERLVMEQGWRQREEERKLREEKRAERRDALLTALLNKLISEESI